MTEGNHEVKATLLALATVLLCACAGVGIVSTNDPLKKLNDAAVLFGQKDRPLPAERLIREAIAIYQHNNDAHGLGAGYREYADLLTSPAVAADEAVYRRDGFLDPSITFDNRLVKATEFRHKALEYYAQSAPELRSAGRFDALTNVYYNMALLHADLGEKQQACSDLESTLEAYQENLQHLPAAKPNFSARFATLPQELDHERQRLGCPM
jgi:tetratricopeptide (TPR) repeat protein